MRRVESMDRLLALGRYGFPFAFGAPESEIVRLRRYSLRERFRTKPALQRLGLTLFCALSYPFFTALEAWRNLRVLKLDCQNAGVGAAWRMLKLGFKGNVPPVEYVFYGFEDPARRALWSEYLYWTDSEAVKLLNRLRGADPDDVQDKGQFARICAEHGLPHAEVLGFSGPELSGELAVGLEDGAEVWVKPVSLQGGVGAECWRWTAAGFIGANGRLLTQGEFFAHLGMHLGTHFRTHFGTARGGALVQRRLRNHPEIAAVSNGWLATLRIVAALRRDGRIVWLANELDLPRGESIVSHGGLNCAVRWADGVIFHVADPAFIGRAAKEDICHPDTGNRLIGRTVPFWRESLELVERAHRQAFRRFATLGWDVALTPDGPLLIEANSGWGRIHAQIVFGPLGRTEMAAMIAEELPR